VDIRIDIVRCTASKTESGVATWHTGCSDKRDVAAEDRKDC